MIVLGLAWSTLTLLILGLGCFALQVFTFRSKRPGWSTVGLFDLFWVGLATLLGIAQLTSLVFPLDGRVLLGVGAVSVIGLIPCARAPSGPFALDRLRPGWRRRFILFLGLFLPVAVLAAARLANTAPTLSYDTGLYHYSAVSLSLIHI